MKKFVPYVNMEAVKDAKGRIEKFVIRTVTYLPKDSKIATSGEGKVADNVLYRPLRIIYDGTSEKFEYYGEDFTIERDDVGLLERGANVKVISASNEPCSTLNTETKDGNGDEGDEGGTIVEYEDPLP